MSVKQGGNTIAGGGSVDQTFDGTSTNAQSGTAVAGAISTKADDDAVVKLTGDQTIGGLKVFSSYVDVKRTGTDYFKAVNQGITLGTTPNAESPTNILFCDNDVAWTAMVSHIYFNTGEVRAVLGCRRQDRSESALLYVGYNAAGNATVTHAPDSVNVGAIITLATRSLAAANDKWGFGQGLKIATKEISPTAAGDTTWSYGITFSATPVVVCCRRSGASTTAVNNGWIRGDIGTSSCKFYVTAASTWDLIAIGH